MQVGYCTINRTKKPIGIPLPIPDLIEHKTSGPEKGRLQRADLEFHGREYERLRAELQRAFEESKLPETPRAGAALHDLLVRLRLTRLGPRHAAALLASQPNEWSDV